MRIKIKQDVDVKFRRWCRDHTESFQSFICYSINFSLIFKSFLISSLPVITYIPSWLNWWGWFPFILMDRKTILKNHIIILYHMMVNTLLDDHPRWCSILLNKDGIYSSRWPGMKTSSTKVNCHDRLSFPKHNKTIMYSSGWWRGTSGPLITILMVIKSHFKLESLEFINWNDDISQQTTSLEYFAILKRMFNLQSSAPKNGYEFLITS